MIARLKSGIRALVGIGLHAVYRLLALGGALQALYMKRRGDAVASAAVRASSLKVPAGPGPYTFIPRDAGFFSVFNFIAGELYDGRRVYPLFELEEYLKYRSENRHFAYFGPQGHQQLVRLFPADPLRRGRRGPAPEPGVPENPSLHRRPTGAPGIPRAGHLQAALFPRRLSTVAAGGA